MLEGSTHCELFNFNIYDFGVNSIQVPTDRVFQFQLTKLRPVHLALHLSCATLQCGPARSNRLVEVSKKRTVKVLLNDTFQDHKTVMVHLNDVLHVPLLSRRLFSMAEWNRCGGTINFWMDRCRIGILGIDDTVINTIDVDPIYAEEIVNQQ
jgi:hypothetical protein